nr:hemolysin A - Vibrio cholerae (fragments) [Vibrio cholerae]
WEQYGIVGSATPDAKKGTDGLTNVY